MTELVVEEPPLAEAVSVFAEPPAPRAPAEATPDRQLRRDLNSSVVDAGGYGLMVGTGETYLPAFVLASGLGEVIAGMVASLPQLAGGIMQLVSPRGIAALGSHRRWVVLCVSLQSLTFLPLVLAAYFHAITPLAALAIATLYWGTGLSTGPAWNTWMGAVVPQSVRARYFASRTRLQQAATLAGFLIGGAAIHAGEVAGDTLRGFAALFLMATLCRMVSAFGLWRTSEPRRSAKAAPQVSILELGRRLLRGGESQRFLYISLVQGAAYFAGPFFAPYMFRVLNLSYMEFVGLISTAYIAKVASLSLFGRYADRFGIKRLLWAGGIGIVPVSGLWLVSDRYAFLIVVQLCAGVAWAAYELAVSLIYFNSIPREERTGLLTIFNLSTTASMVLGSLAGGAVLELFGATRPVYYLLFGGSSLLRLATLFFLRRVPSRLIEGRPARRQSTRVEDTIRIARPASVEVETIPTSPAWTGVPAPIAQSA